MGKMPKPKKIGHCTKIGRSGVNIRPQGTDIIPRRVKYSEKRRRK